MPCLYWMSMMQLCEGQTLQLISGAENATMTWSTPRLLIRNTDVLHWKLHPSGLKCLTDCLYIQKAKKQRCLSILLLFITMTLRFWKVLLLLFGVCFLLRFFFFCLVFTHSLRLTRKLEIFSPLEITRPNPALIAKPSSNLQKNSTYFSATLLKLAVAQKYIHNTSSGSF